MGSGGFGRLILCGVAAFLPVRGLRVGLGAGVLSAAGAGACSLVLRGQTCAVRAAWQRAYPLS